MSSADRLKAEHVEVGGRAVGVDREQRQPVGAEQRLEVDPGGVGPLGHRIGALVEDLVEDLQALVGQADLVGVRVDQQPGHSIRGSGRGAALRLRSRCSERASATLASRGSSWGHMEFIAGGQATGVTDARDPAGGPGCGDRGQRKRCMWTFRTRPMAGERGDGRRAAVGHERQRDAGHRHDAHGHAHVLEHLEDEHGQHPDADEGARTGRGPAGRCARSARDHPEQAEHDGRARRSRAPRPPR